MRAICIQLLPSASGRVRAGNRQVTPSSKASIEGRGARRKKCKRLDTARPAAIPLFHLVQLNLELCPRAAPLPCALLVQHITIGGVRAFVLCVEEIQSR